MAVESHPVSTGSDTEEGKEAMEGHPQLRVYSDKTVDFITPETLLYALPPGFSYTDVADSFLCTTGVPASRKRITARTNDINEIIKEVL